ncbi:muts domain V-domain-containing protein [Cokeromyces recurvatus]|uniref:muts domain V-domain-containing protein n=1 Tax=Cokeromyces recurvatus TaxID=90255 RepID=UPI00221F81E8|nr:muts domain V-domain-containing protein [Cokeromyces recurvatus]KAI7900009.1 muts domain V-domain-containing protein [Cokeromyces recurvatus]
MSNSKRPSQQSSLLSFFSKKPSVSTNGSTAQEATTSIPITEKKPTEEPTKTLAVKERSSTHSKKDIEENEMDVDQSSDEDEIPIMSSLGRTRKRVNYKESDNSDVEDSPESKPTGKKKRLVRRIADDDSDDDFKPTKEDNVVDEDEDEFMDDIPEEDIIQAEKNILKKPPMTPLAEKFKHISVESPSRNIKRTPFVNAFSRITSKSEKSQDRMQKFKEKNEERYYWLQDIKDVDGNRIGTAEYDPRTLYIPKSAWDKFTPFERQYWEVKHKHWDTVVFFKKGKFYELYEKDADIGHTQFDLKMTDRVNMRMVGVPEMSFDYWAAQFIAKGYKVAKVDQMETAIGKSMREKSDGKTSKADKVIRRELTSVLTAGTLVDAGLLTNELGTYCMSIKEQCDMDDKIPPKFGICFVDTSTAEFNLVHFEDDIHRTKFETLIMQIKPRELVTEKGGLSKATTRMLKSILNEPLWNKLQPETEFWDARITEDEININGYFDIKESNEHLTIAMKEARQDPLLMSAFGGLIWYLRTLKLDKELLSAKNILMYDPIRQSTSLVLDGQTLANLEIFQNSSDGSTDGTVFKLLANSITPFGKRLFKQWLCHPLRRIEEINARLDAVEDLMRLRGLHDTISKEMASIPDLERLISRIHSGRIRVKEFLAALQGFKTTGEIIRTMTENRSQYTSALLGRLIDQFPQIGEKLDSILKSFIIAEVDIDYGKSRTIIPNSGMNNEWDTINQQIKDMEEEFNRHLFKVKKQLKCSTITYKDLGKDIYQLEVPKNISVPRDWDQLSTTSKVSRYWDSTIKRMVIEYKELLETKNAFVKKFVLQVYASFDESYDMWLNAVQSIAQLDALMGLAKGSLNMGEPACRPILLDQEKSVIEFEELRHPCVVPGVATDFIPNDVGLGGDQASVIVLTGPNMGGKSTLLRQTCVAIILAQLGGYVPARSCRLTPCDRIYTRIGANDNIMAGQSTFMVELAETSKILKEATSRSMVILDELGRGTSTYDGYAIAYSVLHHLSTHIGCLGMFATHYHTLCKEFERNPEINNMHMSYMVGEDNHSITFLYKLTPGICEKSFGMNVAMMAGIPMSIVERATEIAEETEKVHHSKDTTYANIKDDNVNITPAIIADLQYIWSNKREKLPTQRILSSFQNIHV